MNAVVVILIVVAVVLVVALVVGGVYFGINATARRTGGRDRAAGLRPDASGSLLRRCAPTAARSDGERWRSAWVFCLTSNNWRLILSRMVAEIDLLHYGLLHFLRPA